MFSLIFAIVFLFILGCGILAIIGGVIDFFNGIKTRVGNRSVSQNSLNKQSVSDPTSDILETIRLYKEIKPNRSSMDKYERIRRCNSLLTDFEWYSDLSKPENREAQAKANWKAIYDAVFESDVYYEGDRYKNQSMSDICLEIIERSKIL